MADSKKLRFSKLPILDIFVKIPFLELVVLIDAKGIDVAQPIWPRDCPTFLAQKWPKNTKMLNCIYTKIGNEMIINW